MKKGRNMMKELDWEDNGREIIAHFKVSRAIAARLQELAETGEYIIDDRWIESPYAIVGVDGQVAEFAFNYEGLELDDNITFEGLAWNMIVADMDTVGATVS